MIVNEPSLFSFAAMSFRRGMEDICDRPPELQLDLLQAPRKLRRRGSRPHTCHELRRACFWQRQIWLDEPLPARLSNMRVRMVHIGHTLSTVGSLGLFRTRDSSSSSRFNDVASGNPVPMPESYVKCEVPLMWWPLWGYNIGEYFQNSALGIAELVAAGVIDPTTVQLAPEVGGWPLRDFQTGMLKAFTDLPVRTTGQLAPRCPAKGVVKRKTEKASKCPPPRCYERMLVCRFRDVYEYQPPIAPWSAARAIVRSLRLPPRLPPRLLPLSGEEASSPTRFSVVFASRGHTQNGARLLTNEKGLIELCRRWIPPPACSRSVRGRGEGSVGRHAECEPWVFGRRGFRRDVDLVQEANVLVGTHGAALVHAIFMRRGSGLVEIRPYGFQGAWPDKYHLAMALRENATHAFVLQTRDRSLCSPVPPANVSAWDARPLNTFVQPNAFVRALAAVACARSSGSGSASRALVEVPNPAATAPFEYDVLRSVVIDNGLRPPPIPARI